MGRHGTTAGGGGGRHDGPAAVLRGWLRALRPYQWVKNLLVLVPLAAAHAFRDPDLLLRAGIAFGAFCLAASSAYLTNDVADVVADRQHPRKRHRPFASGLLDPGHGRIGAAVLALGSLALGVALGGRFLAGLAAYYLGTVLYSWRLKRVPVLDVLVLSGLYTVRMLAGADAVAVEPSFWLLAFAMFIFLSLALVKRCAEMQAVPRGEDGTLAGRGYLHDDFAALYGLGTAAGYLAVLVLALYINSADAISLYAHPRRLWTLCPLFLYWVSRTWLLTSRGQMHDDPIVFAFRDRVSLGVGALVVVAIVAAA
ncbi:MAG: UbiA family prenyltransferase [Proteobacteria bacterium]|nr:UbiA family prenyltransferase [Pseudomonadota bacterium]